MLIHRLSSSTTLSLDQCDMCLASWSYSDLEWSGVMGERVNSRRINRLVWILGEVETVKKTGEGNEHVSCGYMPANTDSST